MFRIWGFDPEQGPPDMEVAWRRIHPEDRQAIAQKQIEKAIAGGFQADVGLESRIILPDGTLKYVHRTCHPVFDGTGNVIEYIGTTVDVTARKIAEEALRNTQMELTHANRIATIGQLTASIAHEVNQPIATARNNAASALNFLSRFPPDLDEVREALECVVNDTDRAGGIIDRIRAHVQKVPPRNACFDINEAINELIALARSEAANKRVTVRTDLAEGISPVRGDRVQLQQVVLNLILNAIEAMNSVDGGAPRDLSISTEVRGADEILVSVRDSGPGIDSEYLERVFDSFYTTKPTGMGLGLSICRSIVDAHGGRLWAEANKPRGTVFQFILPAGKNS
jgi:C4-dicarboxylate-specific signal transduction histidine kinase